MKQSLSTPLAFVCILASTGPAPAPIIPLNKTEWIAQTLLHFEELGETHGLSNQETRTAMRAAGAWYWAWPCKGDISRLPDDVHFPSLGTWPVQKAPIVYVPQLMAAHFFAEDPRQQHPHACAFALDLANLYGG